MENRNSILCTQCNKNKIFCKGFCNYCYRKNYKLTLKKSYINDIVFKSLLKKVEEGITISNACKLLNIDRNYLYDNISTSQKLQLKQTKTLNKFSNLKGLPPITYFDIE